MSTAFPLDDLVLRPLLFTALLALAFFPLEHAFALRQARTLGSRAFWTDVAFASVGQILVRFALVFGLGAALSSIEARGLGAPLLAAVSHPSLRSLLEVVVGLCLFELGGYAYHRLAHRVPVLWRMHAVHHGSLHLDWLASFRQHPLEIVLMTFMQNAPLVWCGIPLGTHATVLLLLKVHTVFVHANLRVRDGAWSQWIASPAFHHRHHAPEAATKNFASLFPWLDRVFGTYAATQSSGAAKNSSTSPRRIIVSA